MKNIKILFLSIVLSISFTTQIYANEGINVEDSPISNDEEITISTSEPMMLEDGTFAYDGIELINPDGNGKLERVTGGGIGQSLTYDPRTGLYQLYTSISANTPVNGYSGNIEITSTNLLSKTVYLNRNFNKSFTAGTIRYVYLCDVSIPSTVTKVKINPSNQKVYSLTYGWTSATGRSITFTLNQ